MAIMKSPVAISVIVAALLIRISEAVNHTVGGPNGSWDTNTNLKSWVTSTTFVVGDNLVFQYTLNHDVTEVPKAEYDSCQAANPIRTYIGGSTVISLDSLGKRYFICTTPGHCGQGMKLEIDTVTASSSPPPESPATPPPSESTATPPPESNAAAPPPQALSSPKSPPPTSPPPPTVAESPKSSANKDSFGVTAAIGLCTGLMVFLAF